jgi:hypothetical protein
MLFILFSIIAIMTSVTPFISYFLGVTSSRWIGKYEHMGGFFYEAFYSAPSSGTLFFTPSPHTNENLKSVRVGVNAPAGFHFIIRKEKWLDSWAKRIGLATEFHISEAKADAALYIESDDSVVGELVQKHPEVGTTLLEVFNTVVSYNTRAYKIYCAHQVLWVELGPPRLDARRGGQKSELKARECAQTLAPLLRRVSEHLKSAPTYGKTSRAPYLWRKFLQSISMASATFSGLCFAYTFIFSSEILFPRELLLWTLPFSCSALFLFLAVIVLTLKRSSRCHRVLLQALTLGCVGFIGSGYFLALNANIEFDKTAVKTIEVDNAKIEKAVHVGRLGKTGYWQYRVSFDDWRPGHEGRRASINITERSYGEVNDSSATLKVRSGYLGFEWAEGY